MSSRRKGTTRRYCDIGSYLNAPTVARQRDMKLNMALIVSAVLGISLGGAQAVSSILGDHSVPGFLLVVSFSYNRILLLIAMVFWYRKGVLLLLATGKLDIYNI
jgi:hypothetical protein